MLLNNNGKAEDSSWDSGFPLKITPITDDYKITHEIIGVGESGRVMACFARKDNMKYALKVLRDGPRTRREIFLHYITNVHENIVSIIDVFENTFDGVKCLLVISEFLEGGDLLTRFENQGRFPYNESEVSNVVSQIGSAIKFLHSLNIAHRDIKLENILCSSMDSKNCVYKLGDFGFAKRYDDNELMKSPCCTPTYVCPEILSHEGYDKACDMWALGVLIYILLCGYPPFYSMKGLAFSPGMRNRITIGLYAFPPEDWDHITNSAKKEIENLLQTDPAKRLTIEQLLNSEFCIALHNKTSISSRNIFQNCPDFSADSAIENASDGDEINNCEGCGGDGIKVVSTKNIDTFKCRNRSNRCTNDNKRLCSEGNCSLEQMRQFGHRGFKQPGTPLEKPQSLSNGFLLQLETKRNISFFTLSHSIKDEVGRALNMIRLSANDIYLRLPQHSSQNSLLQRRRKLSKNSTFSSQLICTGTT